MGWVTGGVGDEGGEWERRRERRRGQRCGEEGGAVLCLLFLGVGDDMIDLGLEEGVGGEGGEWGNGGDRDAADKEETKAARCIVSFSSEKETKERWPPLLLCI